MEPIRGGWPSVLADDGSERPPAPEWFNAALAAAPERQRVAAEGTDLEVLSWGEAGRPAILLLHGFSAHADWWSFLAPYLATNRRVVALSFSGMGRSGWRASYSMQQNAREVLAVAEALDLFAAPYPPIVVGHSYGGFVTRIVADGWGRKLGGVILVDAALASAEPEEYLALRGRRHRVYPQLAAALARFRFVPAQNCANPYIVDFLARTSLAWMAGDEPGVQGWSWCFDPDLRANTAQLPVDALTEARTCPVALVFGERSKLMQGAHLENIRRVTTADVPWVVIPDADHHIMVDQPLALVAALRALIAAWQPAVTPLA